MSVNVTMRSLLDAGVHYGHQTRRWNPQMSEYIFGARNGIHIIDLQKTVRLFKSACDYLEGVTSKGGHVLFVGTKRLARDMVREQADRSKMYYVNHRWLGGTLTNYKTIRQSIHRLKRLDRMMKDGTVSKLTKKEALGIEREVEKLERNIGGIKDMPGLPAAIFIVDTHKETIAIQEARKLGIPVVGISDTNSDPTVVDYPIPGNDDSIKSLNLFISTAADACIAGRAKVADKAERAREDQVEAGSFHDEQGHTVKVEKVDKSESK